MIENNLTKTGTQQLKESFEKAFEEMKNMGLKADDFEEWLFDKNPEYNTKVGGKRLQNVYAGRSSDLSLTLLIQEFVTEKKAA